MSRADLHISPDLVLRKSGSKNQGTIPCSISSTWLRVLTNPQLSSLFPPMRVFVHGLEAETWHLQRTSIITDHPQHYESTSRNHQATGLYRQNVCSFVDSGFQLGFLRAGYDDQTNEATSTVNNEPSIAISSQCLGADTNNMERLVIIFHAGIQIQLMLPTKYGTWGALKGDVQKTLLASIG